MNLSEPTVHPSLVFGHYDFSHWLRASYAAVVAAAMGINFSLPHGGGGAMGKISSRVPPGCFQRYKPYAVPTDFGAERPEPNADFQFRAYESEGAARERGFVTSAQAMMMTSASQMAQDYSTTSSALLSDNDDLKSMERMLQGLRQRGRPASAEGFLGKAGDEL